MYPKVILMKEASAFIEKQPLKAQQKIYYNIFKVEEGVMEVEIFKKLENTEIWEFRTLYNGVCYRLLAFWDTDEDTLNRHSWHHKKDTENASQRNRKGGKHKK